MFDDAVAAFAHKGWLRVNWTDYNNTSGETHPAVGDVDGDAAEEIVLGLGAFAFQGGWIEIRDDFAGGFVSLGWRTATDAAGVGAGVATFPAIGRSH